MNNKKFKVGDTVYMPDWVSGRFLNVGGARTFKIERINNIVDDFGSVTEYNLLELGEIQNRISISDGLKMFHKKADAVKAATRELKMLEMYG